MAQLQEGPWGTRLLRPHVLCARPLRPPSYWSGPTSMPQPLGVLPRWESHVPTEPQALPSTALPFPAL